MNQGKAFELRFARSLRLLPGITERLLDGGSQGRERVMGDYHYFSPTGHSYLFECKATARRSLPIENVKEHQRESLRRFEALSPMHHAAIAICFYTEKDRTGRMFLAPIAGFDELVDGMDAASVPISACEERFIECPRVVGCMWEIELWEE